MQHRSWLEAVAQGRCPRCREGRLFVHQSFGLRKYEAYHEQCPHCGLRFEKEPGFWYGAMYVSYAISTGYVLVAAFCLYWFFGDPSIWVYGLVTTAVILLGVPFTYRASRSLWIHVFGGVKYNPALNEVQSKPKE